LTLIPSPFDKPKTLNYIEYMHVDVTQSLAEDEDELLFLFDTSSHKVFREERESSFQEKCMDFHEIHPRVTYDLFHDQYTLTNDVLHIALCMDIISFLDKTSMTAGKYKTSVIIPS
jgi:hypothetical protein